MPEAFMLFLKSYNSIIYADNRIFNAVLKKCAGKNWDEKE
jgi:hypothetical protein